MSFLHVGKIIVYGSFLNIKLEIWIFAVIIGCVMMAGTILANKFVRKINTETFKKYVSVVMIIMGIYMIFF